MTSWGNIKQRAAFAAAASAFILAIVLANEADPRWALVSLTFGVIFAVGVWALGLPKSEDPDNAETMNAIR